MKYCIYMVTNTINNKKYIGQTNNFEKRKKEHSLYDINDNCIFHKALKKYGYNNFLWEVIAYADTKEEVDELEKYYIKFYDTYKTSGKGYNMTKGGDGGSMWNARPIVQLELNGSFVRRYDSAGECREYGFHDSDVLVSCKNPNRTVKGYMFMFEDEYEEKGAREYIKPKSSSCKKVMQYNLKGELIAEFDSLIEASESTNTNRTSISGCLSGTYKTANGFIWRYEGQEIEDIENHKKNKKGKHVYQIDENGNIVNEFDRVSDAGKYLGVNYKSIHKVVDIPNRKAYGYTWVTKIENFNKESA